MNRLQFNGFIKIGPPGWQLSCSVFYVCFTGIYGHIQQNGLDILVNYYAKYDYYGPFWIILFEITRYSNFIFATLWSMDVLHGHISRISRGNCPQLWQSWMCNCLGTVFYQMELHWRFNLFFLEWLKIFWLHYWSLLMGVENYIIAWRAWWWWPIVFAGLIFTSWFFTGLTFLHYV